MKKSLICASVLLCCACATGGGYREFSVAKLNAGRASLQVINDQYVIVNQEPIYIKQNDDNEIIWYLPPNGAYYFLPKGSARPGIVFEHPMPRTECDNYGDRWTYRCTYKRAERKRYKYTINVTDGKNVAESDPTVMND